MSSHRNNDRSKSSPITITLLLIISGVLFFLGLIQDRLVAAKLLFLLNPRYYPEWTWKLLWLIAIWSILDTVARLFFFARGTKGQSSSAGTLQDAQYSPTYAPISDMPTTDTTQHVGVSSPQASFNNRRLAPIIKWNLASAVFLLLVALLVGKFQDWDYRSVSSTCLITKTCSPPAWRDFCGKGVRLDQASLNDSRFTWLSRLLGVALLALTVLQIAHCTWLGRICRRVGDFVVNRVLTRPLLTLISTLLLWDGLQYVQTFLCWSFYRYFYMPLVSFMYHPRLTTSLFCPIGVAILLFINLRIVLLAQKQEAK